MKKIITTALCWIFVSGIAFAEEGMWLPEQLPELTTELNEVGLNINTRQWADLTGFPMGAIISLGGCSASFVSPKGLLITNHHCVFDSIQFNSTAENNLIEKGFTSPLNLKMLRNRLPGIYLKASWVMTDTRKLIKERNRSLRNVKGIPVTSVR